jgi:hypothetical protein
VAVVVSLLLVAGVVGTLVARFADRSAPDAVVRTGGPVAMPLARAFPGSAVVRAEGVGRTFGEVSPAGLLPDGTVYGVAREAAGARDVAVAVTVDPRTGRRAVVARGDAVTAPRFVAGNGRWLLGVTEKPRPVQVGHGCDLAGNPCRATPLPMPRYWCHDLSTGRTVDLTAHVARLGPQTVSADLSVTDTSVVLTANDVDRRPQLALAGCAGTPQPLGFALLPQGRGVAPGTVLSVEDRFAAGHRVVAQDTRSGRTRTVLDGTGPVALANAYGLAWDGGDGAAPRFAPWGEAERSLDVRALGGTSRLGVVAAGERVFLLGDASRPVGELRLYDPVHEVITTLGRTHAGTPWTRVWAAGRYVLWDAGGTGDHRLLDLGPQPAPPTRALDDLRVQGRPAVTPS